MTRSRREEFLSEEDLDLASCSEAELRAWSDLWLRLAQATNDADADEYSHGVFRRAPGAVRAERGPTPEPSGGED